VLCVEVEAKAATRNDLWILPGMIALSRSTKFVYRRASRREDDRG